MVDVRGDVLRPPHGKFKGECQSQTSRKYEELVKDYKTI